MAGKRELFNWIWSSRPLSQEQFEAMMDSLDKHLAEVGLRPHQRGLNAALVVSKTLRLSGTPLIGLQSIRGQDFSASDIMAKVYEWYEKVYADKVKIDFSLGSFVIGLHGNLWRAVLPRIFGTVSLFIDKNLQVPDVPLSKNGSPPASHNILLMLEGMTQAYANRLSDTDLVVIGNKVKIFYSALIFLEELSGSCLFDQARAEYRHSVEALLTGTEIAKARWETAHCAEKVLKGLLKRNGHAYPTSGAKGHDIVHLGQLVNEKLGAKIEKKLLESIHCPTSVRYGDEESTLSHAFNAHESLLSIFSVLSGMKLEL